MKTILSDEEINIIYNDEINVLYFYTKWIPIYHNKMSIMIDKVEESYKEIKFHSIDSDLFPSLNKRFKIKMVPTTLAFKNGKEILKIEGIQLTKAFKHSFFNIKNS